MTETPTPKPPLRLVVEGREPVEVVAYACGACGLVFTREDSAREHCELKPCQRCGKTLDRGYVEKCWACQTAEVDEREDKRIQSLPRVKYADYDGPGLYFEHEYFDDFDELAEHCIANDLAVPVIVEAVATQALELPAAIDVVSNAVESSEFHEDTMDHATGHPALEKLDAALRACASELAITNLFPRHDLAVDLTDEIAGAGLGDGVLPCPVCDDGIQEKCPHCGREP